jgi:hypothetical protein
MNRQQEEPQTATAHALTAASLRVQAQSRSSRTTCETFTQQTQKEQASTMTFHAVTGSSRPAGGSRQEQEGVSDLSAARISERPRRERAAAAAATAQQRGAKVR